MHGNNFSLLRGPHLMNRKRLDFVSAGPFHIFRARSLVDHGFVHHLYLSDVDGIIYDHSVVNDDGLLPVRLQKSPLLHINKCPRFDGFVAKFHIAPASHSCFRGQRSPAGVSPALPPGNPRRSPKRLRHPNPTKIYIQMPASIMIGRPAPAFVTDPIPPGISSLPMTISVRTPIPINSRRCPATTIPVHVHPSSVPVEWFVEITLHTNFHHCRLRLRRNIHHRRLWLRRRRRFYIHQRWLRLGRRGRVNGGTRRRGWLHVSNAPGQQNRNNGGNY